MPLESGGDPWRFQRSPPADGKGAKQKAAPNLSGARRRVKTEGEGR